MSKTYINATLRKQVYQRARGCCEYCLIPDIAAFAPHEVDHVIAEKHGGLTKADNLALSWALLIESMNGSKLEGQNPIITLLNHAKNVNSYPDSATPFLAAYAISIKVVT